MRVITMIQKMPFAISKEEVDGVNIKYIPDTNEMYAVSRDGMVYSFTYKMQGRPIGAPGPGGYTTCSIDYANGKRKTEYVHRLVAQAFIPNPEGKKQISHKNEDRADNRSDNLCWATAKENCDTGSHNEKLAKAIKEYYKNRHIFGKVAKRVSIMDKDENELFVAPSIQAAADWIREETGKDDNSSSVQISAILQGKPGFKTVGGFKVKEVTEEDYQVWTREHISTLISEEDIDLSLVPMNKVSKIDGIKVVNRKMDPETGELSYDIRTYQKGDKITNELH